MSSCSEDGKTKDVRTADVDGDGRPDIWKYYKEVDDPEHPGEKKNALVRQDLDLNWDGRIDVCRWFDARGRVEREELDLDYDGRSTSGRTYVDGVISVSELDRNKRRQAGHHPQVQGWKARREGRRHDRSGQIDRWEYYDGKNLDRIGVDLGPRRQGRSLVQGRRPLISSGRALPA